MKKLMLTFLALAASPVAPASTEKAPVIRTIRPGLFLLTSGSLGCFRCQRTAFRALADGAAVIWPARFMASIRRVRPAVQSVVQSVQGICFLALQNAIIAALLVLRAVGSAKP